MIDLNDDLANNEELVKFVKDTLSEYRNNINFDLKKFNKNLIDSTKLKFDAKMSGVSESQLIDIEARRQNDKTNNNIIGMFNQNIFKLLCSSDWVISDVGFDMVNEKQKIFVEIKNKHNTMNASSTLALYNKMLEIKSLDDDNICYLVEVISKRSKNVPWGKTVNRHFYKSDRIRKISMDKFCEIITGDEYAFKKLIDAIYLIIDKSDSVEQEPIQSKILDEIINKWGNIWDGLKKLSFGSYKGF